MKKITAIGRVSKDPSWKSPQNGGNRFLIFDVSVSNGKNQDGTWKPSDYFNCMLYGKQAETLFPYLLKGNKIYIDGIPSCRAWMGQDGVPKSAVSVMVNTIELLNNANATQHNSNTSNSDNNAGDNAIVNPDEIPF